MLELIHFYTWTNNILQFLLHFGLDFDWFTKDRQLTGNEDRIEFIVISFSTHFSYPITNFKQSVSHFEKSSYTVKVKTKHCQFFWNTANWNYFLSIVSGLCGVSVSKILLWFSREVRINQKHRVQFAHVSFQFNLSTEQINVQTKMSTLKLFTSLWIFVLQ